MYFYTYLGVIVLMGIITYLAYKIDKRKAINNKWRTKESTLLLLSLLFGSFGGIFAMYHLRHKNRHWYFVVINFLSLIIDIAIGVFIFKYSF